MATWTQFHLADLTPLVDFLHAEIDKVRIVSRADPLIKALPNGKGARQLVTFFLAARPRFHPDGTQRSEPSCVQLSVWGPVGEIVPQAPRVGEVVRIRGLTGVKPTYPFDKWHAIELQSSWQDLQVVPCEEDASLPWEKNLNPNRTVQTARSQSSVQAPPQGASTSVMTSVLDPPSVLAPPGVLAQPKYCAECGGALLGPGRRTHCANGTPH